MSRQLNTVETILALLHGLADVLVVITDYQAAENYVNEGLALAYKVESRWFIVNMKNVKGNLYLQQEKYHLAFQSFNNALEEARQLGSQNLIGVSLYSLAKLAYAEGNIQEAHCKGQESLKIFRTINYNRIREVEQWLAELPSAK